MDRQESSEFDTFFDFGSYDDLPVEKQDGKRLADETTIRHEMLGPSIGSDLDDPFVDM